MGPELDIMRGCESLRLAALTMREWWQLLEGSLNDRFRSRHTMPATAPRMITTPMAIGQDMRAETTPGGPYFLSSEVTMPEKMTEKTASMP